MQFKKELEGVYSLVIPYKDIFTTIYAVKTPEGVLLLDAATYDSDINDILLPALDALLEAGEQVRGVFITHNHGDHAGGLGELLRHMPQLVVYSNSEALREKHPSADIRTFLDGERLFDELYAVTIPGHTADSAGVLWKTQKCLITGDSLQLHGIFGSGLWGANIRLVDAHFEALKKLEKLTEAEELFTAHHYEPYGRTYHSREAILAALDACRAPLLELRELIAAHPDEDDAVITARFNGKCCRPTVGAHVTAAVRASKL